MPQLPLPQGFLSLCLLDASALVPSKQQLLHDPLIERVRELFRHVNFSLLAERVQTGGQHLRDFWIVPGWNAFMSDYFVRRLGSEEEFRVRLSRHFDRYKEYAEHGWELAPLSMGGSNSNSNSAGSGNAEQTSN
jgi:hypothetical protein